MTVYNKNTPTTGSVATNTTKTWGEWGYDWKEFPMPKGHLNDYKTYPSEEFQIDYVNHPPHYERENAIECIDEMIMIFGPEPTYWFCILNAHKYRYRAGDKGDLNIDKKKSDYYIKKAKEILEKYELEKKLWLKKSI